MEAVHLHRQTTLNKYISQRRHCNANHLVDVVFENRKTLQYPWI